jgi:hypothetical protein
MFRRAAWLPVALCLLLAGEARANVPASDAALGEQQVESAVRYPSWEHLLRALGGKARKNIRIRYEVIHFRVGPPRFYPLVGKARLVQKHIKCIINSNQGREIVYVDMDHLLPAR